MRRYFILKRLIDILISLFSIIVLSPMLIIIVTLIKIESEGTIIFKQKRVGKDRKIFEILKFRTMKIDTPCNTPTHLLENPDYWITNVGRFLRKYSLDELPQLYNILVGEMSLVGPRPALWNQYDLIEHRDKYSINDLVPGLTGWAQVNGRDELSIESKVEYDRIYLERISFLFDLKCILYTVRKVLKSEGVVEGKVD